jgi:hypothetical protein
VDPNATNRSFGANFGKGASGAPREPLPGMQYNVDRTTFGEKGRISEADATFGGLCLTCHARDTFAGESKNAQLHRTVKGWGSNKEHAFPCAKCHQAHNSGLPRLMQTNCFEQGPAGLRENSGLAWLPYGKQVVKEGGNHGQAVASASASAKNKVVGCHVRQFGKTNIAGTRNQEEAQWNKVTTW